MFDNLSERLDSAFKLLKGEGRINEINIATTVKEIRRALVDADVNYKVQTGRQAGMVQGSDRQVRFRVQAVRDPVSGGGWHSGASKGQGRDVG